MFVRRPSRRLLLPAVGMALAMQAPPASAVIVATGTFFGTGYGSCFQVSTYVCDFNLYTTFCREWAGDSSVGPRTGDCSLDGGHVGPGVIRTRGNGNATSCTTTYAAGETVQALVTLRSPVAGSFQFYPDRFVHTGAVGSGSARFTARLQTLTTTLVVEGTLAMTQGACDGFDVQSTTLIGTYTLEK